MKEDEKAQPSWNDSLVHMAQVAEVFNFGPHVQDKVNDLKKTVNEYKRLVGVFNDKKVLEKAQTKLERDQATLEKFKETARLNAQKVEQERSSIATTVKTQTTAKTAKIITAHKEKIKELDSKISDVDATQRELNRLTDEVVAEQDQRETHLREYEAATAAIEKNNTRAAEANSIEQSRLQAIADTFKNMTSI